MTATIKTADTEAPPSAIKCRRGVTSIEYALIAGGIALAVAFAAPAVGTSARAVFCKVAGAMGGSASCPDTAVAKSGSTSGSSSSGSGVSSSGSGTTTSGSGGSTSSGSGTAAPTPCPTGAGLSGSYEPSCFYTPQPSCPGGYGGSYSWDSGSETWVDNCVAP